MRVETAKQVLDDANNGIVGISDDIQISGGYDNIYTISYDEFFDNEEKPSMTTLERGKLADVMISRWELFKNNSKEESL